jgi:hypothetical protein
VCRRWEDEAWINPKRATGPARHYLIGSLASRTRIRIMDTPRTSEVILFENEGIAVDASVAFSADCAVNLGSRLAALPTIPTR